MKPKPCLRVEYAHMKGREEPEPELHRRRMILPREEGMAREVKWMTEGMVAWDNNRLEGLQYAAVT